MATKLSGKNFQSWEEFELIIDGLTVVVGDSNLGKSAIERSFRGLVRNELNGGQLRVGSDLMEVSATADGHTIEASRKKGTKGSIVYVVDKGEPYAKLNGAIPKEVLDLNMGEIQIGEVTLDPIFATQFGSQFIIQEKPGPLNAILGAFSSTERLEAGKKLGNKRIAEKNAQATALAKETRETEERYATLEALGNRAEHVQSIIDTLEPKVRTQERTLSTIDILIEHKNNLDLVDKVLDRLIVPDPDQVARAIRLVANYASAAAAHSRRDSILAVLKQLVVPDAQAVEHGIKLVSSYSLAAKAKGRHTRTADLLSQLVVPDVTVAVQMATKISNFSKLASASTHGALVARCLGSIESVIAQWTAIVALHKRGKALTEAGTALEILARSTTKQTIASLNEVIVQIDARVIQVERLRVGITRYESLAQAIEVSNLAQTKLQTIEILYTAAQTAIAALEAEHLAEQKKTQGKGVVCNRCGEIIAAA